MRPLKFLLFFGFFWSSLTCVFLGFLIHGAFHQLKAMSFASTQGTVESIKMTEGSDNDGGTTYGVDIAYRYNINGRWYTSKRLRFMQTSSSDSWASEMVRQFAVGTHPTVYYNPTDPAEAVLIRGIQGEDLFLALFLTPFTMVMLGLWAAIAITWRGSRGSSLGLRVSEEGTITRIRPAKWVPAGVGAVALGLGAFIATFIVAFLFGGFHPSMTVACTTWCVVLSIAIVAAVATRISIQSAAHDITLNVLTKTLGAPKGLNISYADINQINVVRKTRSSDSGTSDNYDVWLDYKQGGQSKQLKLRGSTQNKDRAWEFAEWIADKIGVPVQGAPEYQLEPLKSQ